MVAYQLACAELLGNGDLADLLFDDFKNQYGFEAVLFNRVKEVLERLSSEYKLGIVTNGRARCQNAKIDYVGIRHLFQSIMISEEFGVKKPHSSIFEACLAELRCAPSDCICIGDNPDNDLQPAKKLGMQTIWIRNGHFSHTEIHDQSIKSIAEIEQVLNKLS